MTNQRFACIINLWTFQIRAAGVQQCARNIGVYKQILPGSFNWTIKWWCIPINPESQHIIYSTSHVAGRVQCCQRLCRAGKSAAILKKVVRLVSSRPVACGAYLFIFFNCVPFLIDLCFIAYFFIWEKNDLFYLLTGYYY